MKAPVFAALYPLGRVGEAADVTVCLNKFMTELLKKNAIKLPKLDGPASWQHICKRRTECRQTNAANSPEKG